MDVRNVGEVDARTCDLQAWVVRATEGSPAADFDDSARRIGPEQGPHFAQRPLAVPASEELRGYRENTEPRI